MRISTPLLLTAFLATASGQTLTYEFPPTGNFTHQDTRERYQVCVKGAKWADLITTNVEDERFRFDITSLDFKDGDKIDGRWYGRYAVGIPENFPCKGGILFQKDNLSDEVSLDLTLKATLADGESKLTVCAFYAHYHQGGWQNILTAPDRGFTLTENVFTLPTSTGYGQDYVADNYPWYSRAKTLCRDFEPGVDDGFFSAAELVPSPVRFTFPAVGPTGFLPGICINGAQLATATNSVADYPKYEMSSRMFNRYSNLWMDRYWWETNRNNTDVPFGNYEWAPHMDGWTDGNPCDGALYLQPQRKEQTKYYYEDPRWTNVYDTLEDADKQRLAENEITVEIIPKKDIPFVQICAVVKTTDNEPNYEQTTNWLDLENYGFTNDGTGLGGLFFALYCRDLPTDYSRVTLKLKL